MADTVDIQYIYPPNHDGGTNPVPTRRVVVNFAGISDGTGETEVTKIRLTDLLKHDGSTPTRTTVEKITATITGMTILLAWDRTPDAEIKLLGSGQHVYDYTFAGGFVDPGEAGDRTGDIMLSSLYADTGDSYDIILTLKLK